MVLSNYTVNLIILYCITKNPRNSCCHSYLFLNNIIHLYLIKKLELVVKDFLVIKGNKSCRALSFVQFVFACSKDGDDALPNRHRIYHLVIKLFWMILIIHWSFYVQMNLFWIRNTLRFLIMYNRFCVYLMYFWLYLTNWFAIHYILWFTDLMWICWNFVFHWFETRYTIRLWKGNQI